MVSGCCLLIVAGIWAVWVYSRSSTRDNLPPYSTQTIDSLFKNLLQQLKDKNEAIVDKDKKIVDLQKVAEKQAQQIEELQSDDDISDQTKALIKQARIADAEQLMDKKLSNDQKRSAQTYYEHGQIKELALKYQNAFASFQEAVKLQPTNGKYLNEAGMLADDLGQYDKLLEQALANLKTFDILLLLLLRRNNLGLAWHPKVNTTRHCLL